MIRLIRADSGGEMWVHESRLDEYLAAGHRPAADPREPGQLLQSVARTAPSGGGQTAAAKRKKTTTKAK